MIVDHEFGANYDQGAHQATGGASPRRSRRSGAATPARVLVGLMIASTTAIAARAAIVSIAPATAAAYALAGMPVNLRGLSFADVRATATQGPDGGELIVEGEIVNLRGKETPAPNLRLVLRAGDGRALYAWTTRAPKARLDAHQRTPFRARLAAPPAGVRDVLVKFVEPGDKGAFTETPS